jgi:hypothetical protein
MVAGKVSRLFLDLRGEMLDLPERKPQRADEEPASGVRARPAASLKLKPWLSYEPGAALRRVSCRWFGTSRVEVALSKRSGLPPGSLGGLPRNTRWCRQRISHPAADKSSVCRERDPFRLW